MTSENPEISMLSEIIHHFMKPLFRQLLSESLTEILLEMETRRKQKRYYTRDEACSLLKIGTTTFYRLAQKGKLTILKIEGKTLVDADELDQAVERKEIFRSQLVFSLHL